MLIKPAYRADGLQQHQRLDALRGHHGDGRRAFGGGCCLGRVGRRQGQQRARFPVRPGRVFAGVVAHGIDGFEHLLPVRLVAGAQRGTGFPGQHVVGQVGVFGDFGEILQRIAGRLRAHAAGGLLANQAPEPVAFFSRQLQLPFAVELKGRAFRIADRQLDQRQRDDFLAHRAQRQVFAGQELDRAVVQFGHHRQRFGRDDLHRIAGRLGAVAFHRQPGFLPDIERREVFAADQPFGSGGAAVVGIALGVPVFAHFFRQARVNHRVLQVLDQQRIAAHFAVVVHAEFGVFSGKTGPVAALAQQL